MEYLSYKMKISIATTDYTAWKVSKYRVFSGPYLDTFHVVVQSNIYLIRIISLSHGLKELSWKIMTTF